MKNLILKEFRLAMHPTALIFIFLSAMLIIPNYPYYVTFFYTGLAVFFTCLNGRENHDIFYTLLLPVQKKDVVKARFVFVMLLELIQVVFAIPFAALRQSFNMPGNPVGIDANIAFFGSALLMLGIFNLVFFLNYYKDTYKVGKSFVISSIASFGYMLVAEVLVHVVPFAKNILDTKDNCYLGYKFIVLAVGLVCYLILTFISYRKSQKLFEKLDL